MSYISTSGYQTDRINQIFEHFQLQISILLNRVLDTLKCDGIFLCVVVVAAAAAAAAAAVVVIQESVK